MAVAGLVFLDTSVLLAGLIELGDQSLAADRILDDVASGAIGTPLTAWHCCLEFYSVATRLPAGLRLEPATARQLLLDEILGRFDVRDLPPEARRSFVESTASTGVAGGPPTMPTSPKSPASPAPRSSSPATNGTSPPSGVTACAC